MKKLRKGERERESEWEVVAGCYGGRVEQEFLLKQGLERLRKGERERESEWEVVAGCYGGRVEQEFLLMQGLEPLFQSFRDKTSKFSCVLPTCRKDGFKWFGPRFELDWIGCPNYYMLNGLVHSLSWIGLAAPITPWLHVMLSNLPAMLDARLLRDDTADCEIWIGHRHGF
ncbi:hypothetical protein TIFTF001_023131 [Ficus carica]|uniref:Uncharacterized protein n=1 Tax=Ficus carica TaxID=3494 RepID=A0AA88ALA2_FICCA|nr:hypothetical protein TIFTF001_023131 [Ficus carica]